VNALAKSAWEIPEALALPEFLENQRRYCWAERPKRNVNHLKVTLGGNWKVAPAEHFRHGINKLLSIVAWTPQPATWSPKINFGTPEQSRVSQLLLKTHAAVMATDRGFGVPAEIRGPGIHTGANDLARVLAFQIVNSPVSFFGATTFCSLT
jgi:hypothetical protein